MNTKHRLLVISAHSADFVWRSGGTIAKSIEQGAETLVVCLSYGERGESGELWKEDPNRSEESVKIIRKAQAQPKYPILGISSILSNTVTTTPAAEIQMP